MGMDFGIYVKSKEDANKYFDEGIEPGIVTRELRDALYDEDQVFFCCGRALTGFVAKIADLAGEPDESNDGLQKVSLKKLKKFADMANTLDESYFLNNWQRKGYSTDYYEKEILGFDEELREELLEEKLEFNNLKKYENIQPETVKLIRELDRNYLKSLEKRYDTKLKFGNQFIESIRNLDEELGELATDGDYFASAIKLCKTIRSLIKTFGEKYNVYITFSY